MWMNVDDTGFKIVDVTKGGPAEEAGVKSGDVIMEVDGKPALDIHLYDLRQRLRDDPPGTVVSFTVKRGENTKTIKVTLRDLI
jgi:S1-C subfamily serine protease